MCPKGRSCDRGWTCPPFFFYLLEQKVPSARWSVPSRAGYLSCTRGGSFTCVVLLLCVEMRVFSGKSSMHFMEAMRTLRTFTDSISLQITLTVYVLALAWMLPFLLLGLTVACFENGGVKNGRVLILMAGSVLRSHGLPEPCWMRKSSLLCGLSVTSNSFCNPVGLLQPRNQ